VSTPDGQAAADGAARRGPRRPWSDRERLLLDELERIFFQEGFAELSVADLAARLRVSRTTLYRLAPGRQELLELVVDRMFNQMGKRGRAALAGQTDPAAKVAVYLGAGTASVRAGSLAFNRDLEANPGTRAVYDRHQAIGMGVLADLIEEGVAAGRFRPLPTALVVQIADAAHARLRDPDVLAGLGMTHAQAIDGLIGILLNGVTAPGAGTVTPRGEGAEER
jgi:AcrR family transcriptional regulator